jgi:membrane-associated phospholipid phosphatase
MQAVPEMFPRGKFIVRSPAPVQNQRSKLITSGQMPKMTAHPFSRPLRALLLLAFALIMTARPVAAAEADASRAMAAPYANLFPVEPIAAVDDALPPVASFDLEAIDQAQAPHPAPTHTGFSALFRSIGSDFKAFPQRKSTYVILAIGGAAALLVHPADDDINEKLQESDGLRKALAPGKYIGSTYVQTGVAVGSYLLGRYVIKPDGQKSNKLSHIGFDLLRAQVVASAFVYGLKYAAQRDRPTGECCSFPSGHAAVTFATASVLERHFGYRGAWPTWLIAGYVATSRLTDNRHFASDVLFGAALGVATGWTVVGRHGRDDFAMYPIAVRRGGGIAMTWHLGPKSAT